MRWWNEGEKNCWTFHFLMYTLKATTRRLQIARAIFISATSCFVRLKTLTYVDAACSLASREEFLFLRAFMCFCRSIIVKISTRPGFLSFSFSKNAHTRTLQHISLASALLFWSPLIGDLGAFFFIAWSLFFLAIANARKRDFHWRSRWNKFRSEQLKNKS